MNSVNLLNSLPVFRKILKYYYFIHIIRPLAL